MRHRDPAPPVYTGGSWRCTFASLDRRTVAGAPRSGATRERLTAPNLLRAPPVRPALPTAAPGDHSTSRRPHRVLDACCAQPSARVRHLAGAHWQVLHVGCFRPPLCGLLTGDTVPSEACPRGSKLPLQCVPTAGPTSPSPGGSGWPLPRRLAEASWGPCTWVTAGPGNELCS